MFLKRLCNARRYRRCVRLFQHPLWAHVVTSAAPPWPLGLDLQEGGRLQVPRGRACRRMFEVLLEKLPDPFPVTVADGLVEFQYEGRRFALRPSYSDFYIFYEVMVRDDYRLDDLPQPLGTVVDLGANIGLFSLKLAAEAERVVALEPVKDNYRMAQRLFEESGLAEKITLHKAAISGQSEATVRIYACDGNAGGHSVFRKHAGQWGDTRYENVPAISLADLFAQEEIDHCSLLKCDVEGAEFDVIEQAPLDLLASIDRMVMEVHLNVIQWDLRRLSNFTGRLASAGFHVEHDSLNGRWGRRKRGIFLQATRRQVAARRRAA
jgi:FkbM family methyltransferase